MLLHPNVILDASHEPRLAIIGRSLHRTMNAGSDRLAIGSSPAMTRHTRDVDDEKEDFCGGSVANFQPKLPRAQLGLAWTFMELAAACFPDIYFTPSSPSRRGNCHSEGNMNAVGPL